MSNDIHNILTRLNQIETRVLAESAPSPSKQTPVLFKHVQQIEQEQLDEAQANEEKLLDKLKNSLKDYLATAAEKYIDQDLKDKVKIDLDIGKKDKIDHDLIATPKDIDECGTADVEPQEILISAPVKTITLEDGKICEIHGNERHGFEIRHGNRRLPSRFKRLDQAELALEMFMARRRHNDESADYIEEK